MKNKYTKENQIAEKEVSFSEFFFSANGRISRIEFFTRGFLPITILLFLTFIMQGVLNTQIIMGKLDISIEMANGIVLVMALAISYITAVISIKRFHDFNYNGWTYLFMFIPLVNLIVLLILMFKNKIDTNNRFGNSTNHYTMNGLKWFFLVFNTILLFISLLAFSISNIALDSAIKKNIKHQRVIVINALHGGKDIGSVSDNNYMEKNIVLQISNHLKKILQNYGYQVYMVRDGDYDLDVSSRVEYANKRNADLFISISANNIKKNYTHNDNGLECFPSTYDNTGDSLKLAIKLQRETLISLKKNYSQIHDGGVRGAELPIFLGAQMPSVIFKVGSMLNSADVKNLINNNYQQELALGLANGIKKHFNH